MHHQMCIRDRHNTHINYLRKALSNGKHVLCEKSITFNIAELDEAVSLAKENNVILADAKYGLVADGTINAQVLQLFGLG